MVLHNKPKAEVHPEHMQMGGGEVVVVEVVVGGGGGGKWTHTTSTNERKIETGIQQEIKNDTEIWTERQE